MKKETVNCFITAYQMKRQLYKYNWLRSITTPKWYEKTTPLNQTQKGKYLIKNVIRFNKSQVTNQRYFEIISKDPEHTKYYHQTISVLSLQKLIKKTNLFSYSINFFTCCICCFISPNTCSCCFSTCCLSSCKLASAWAACAVNFSWK